MLRTMTRLCSSIFGTVFVFGLNESMGLEVGFKLPVLIPMSVPLDGDNHPLSLMSFIMNGEIRFKMVKMK